MTDDPTDSYVSLLRAYTVDRAVMDATHEPFDPDAKRCRYCGGPWQQYPSSLFDGHVRCLVSIPFQERLVAFFAQNPGATYADVAMALGVSSSVVRCWWRNIKSPPRRFSSRATLS